MRTNLLLFAVIAICGNLFAQKPAWQPGPRLRQSRFADGAPGAQPNATREIDTTTAKDNLVAGKPVIRLGNVSVPTLILYTPKSHNTGAAVVVFPGGGYHILAMDLEGTEVCDWLNSRGCHLRSTRIRRARFRSLPQVPCSASGRPAIARDRPLPRCRLAYRPPPPRRPCVSAGVDLAAALSTHFDQRLYDPIDAADHISCRPDFAVVIYPGYLALPDQNFAPNPDIRVTDNTPPSFIVQAEDDPVHVENAIVYFLALKNAKVPAELHIYAQGGHGYGLRPTAQPVTTWPRSVEAWLRTIRMLPPSNR